MLEYEAIAKAMTEAARAATTKAAAEGANITNAAAAAHAAIVKTAVRTLVEQINRLEARLDAGPFKFMGVYTQGQDYQKGHVVTDRGSLWHCNLPTRERPGTSGSYAWTLCVKRGNDGRDARQ
jgi:hypothetical protein